jgi:exosortase E/protease (VPEID-CTERM system)
MVMKNILLLKNNTFRFSAIVILLFAEALALSLQVDAQSISPTNVFAWALNHMGDMLRWAIISITLFFVLLFCQQGNQLNRLVPQINTEWQFILAHLLSYLLLTYLSLKLFGASSASSYFLIILWFLTALSTLVSWCRLLQPLPNVLAFISKNRWNLLLAGIIGILLLLITKSAGELWKPLSFITLHGVSFLLSVLFPDSVFIDTPNKLLGLNEFVVFIAPPCSGLEGLITSLFVIGLYIVVLRKELLFPASFILLPLAALLSITLNIVRIALLLIIGAFYSADVAVEGFHSVAGWISAAITAFLVIFVFSSLSIFNKKSTEQTDTVKQSGPNDSNLAWAILVPFVAVLTASLLGGIFFSGFDYLYPVKVIAGCLCLTFFWKTYQLSAIHKPIFPIFAGFITALLWILLVPTDDDYNSTFSEALADMPNGLYIVWMSFRLVGFWLMAPIIEELVFRGYLLARLSRAAVVNDNKEPITFIAIVITSIIFGAMHGAFLAGVLAGLVYGFVRYRSKTLVEPIVAHMVTNILVSVWAFYTGNWGLL